MTTQYDAIGNPTNDGTWTYNWQHGKQLASMTRIVGNETVSFEYNEDGLRTKKTVTNGEGTVITEYVLHGKNIVHMTRGTDEMHFFYGADDKLAVVVFNGTSYRYLYTLQGDVIGLVDGNGAWVVSYRFDAWGKPLGIGGSLASTLGVLQPFRYRGYVFDEETRLYYLRSRYYRAEWGRFVSADSLVGGNLYCYCDNVPSIEIDPDGLDPMLNAPMVRLRLTPSHRSKRIRELPKNFRNVTFSVRFEVHGKEYRNNDRWYYVDNIVYHGRRRDVYYSESGFIHSSYITGDPGIRMFDSSSMSVFDALGPGILRIGSKGPEVWNLQWLLVDAGELSPDEVDGLYGPKTQAAVTEFQYQYPWYFPDDYSIQYGIVGYATIQAFKEVFWGDNRDKMPWHLDHFGVRCD